MVQRTKTKQEEPELNLEDVESSTEFSELDMEVAKYNDPRFEEEARKRLHELVQKIDALAEESKITLLKIFQEAKGERGMLNKFVHIMRRLKDKMTATGSSTHNSLSFLTATIRALDGYREEIPFHISNFQNGIDTLKLKKKEVMETIKLVKAKLKQVNDELAKIKKEAEKETDLEKREFLRAKEQEVVNKLQNVEIKGNKSLKELENLNNVTELFLEMKGGYEILLKQVSNLSEDLKRHKKVLETIGPSVAEVTRVVRTIDRFTNLIGEYRKRDNEEVKLATKAIVEITPAIQNMERPWYTKKTVQEVRKNVKDARKVYKEHFDTDITKLEEYDEHGNPKVKKKQFVDPDADIDELRATE